MSAPQDNDQPVSDPHEDNLRTFDLETDEVLSDDSPTPDRDDVELHPPAQESVSDAHSNAQLAPVKQGWLGRIMRPRHRREQQLQTLQSGYLEMLEMMRSIRTHLDHQVQTQEKLVESLKHFPDAVDGLKSIGQATAQQTEVLGMVREQLEQTAHHEEEIVGSMNNFNKTLNQMDETNRNSTQTVSTLMERSHDSETALRAMMERSEKRMATLTGLMGFLALAAVGFALYVVFDNKKGETPYDAAPVMPAMEESAAVEAMPVIEEPVTTEPVALATVIEDEVDAEVEQLPEAEAIEIPAETEIAPIEEPEIVEPATQESESEEGAEEMLDGENVAADVLPDDESVTALDVIESPDEDTAGMVEAIEMNIENVVDDIEEGVEEGVEESVEEDMEEGMEQGMEDMPEEAPDVDNANPTDEDAAVEVEEEVSTDRPGVKGVVRRVFSFLGNESDGQVLEPVVDELTEAIEVAEKTEPTE